MLELRFWESGTKTGATALLLAANMIQDTVTKSKVSGMVKTYVDLGEQLKELDKLGSVAEAVQKPAFPTLETGVMTHVTRAANFLTKARAMQLWEDDSINRMPTLDALAEKAKETINKFAKYQVNCADVSISKCIKTLQPMLGGYLDGRRWKDLVKDWLCLLMISTFHCGCSKFLFCPGFRSAHHKMFLVMPTQVSEYCIDSCTYVRIGHILKRGKIEAVEG